MYAFDSLVGLGKQARRTPAEKHLAKADRLALRQQKIRIKPSTCIEGFGSYSAGEGRC
jgi:hypothetical protein